MELSCGESGSLRFWGQGFGMATHGVICNLVYDCAYIENLR